MPTPQISRRHFLAVPLAFALAFAPCPTRAQEGRVDLVGTISAKSANAISLLTDGKSPETLTFDVNTETMISRGRTAIAADGIETGEKARISGKTVDGRKVAVMITVLPKR